MTDSKKNLKVKCAISIVFCTFLIAFLIALIVAPDKNFSDEEKRVLSSLPKASLSEIADGSFSDEFEKYVQDQIPLRNLFVGVGSYFDLLIGRNGVDGVYHGSDGYLFNTPVEANSRNISANTSKLCDFADAVKLKSYIMIVPTSGCILSDKLPQTHEEYRDGEIISEIYRGCEKSFTSSIDLMTLFEREKDNRQIYYKTDHHWTSGGAYLAYRAFADTAGLRAIPEDDFDVSSYEGFYGAIYSKSALWGKKPDTMELWRYANSDISVKISDIGKDKTTVHNDLFFEEHLVEYDMYPTFIDGNHSLTEITNNNVDDGTLLVLKDSYANTLVSLLANNYHKIIMIDMRYYRTLAVSDAVKEYGADSMLVVYGTENIVNDTNLTWLR